MMRRFALIALAGMLTVLSASGCGRGRVDLTAKDAGTTVELSPGQTMTVKLAGNPTTGYNWEAASPSGKVLAQVGRAQFEPQSSAIGAPGDVTLTFKAVSAGRTRLKLVYRRSFEKKVPPVKTFEVTIAVK